MPYFEFPFRPFIEMGGPFTNGAQYNLAADTDNFGIVFQAEYTMSVKKAWLRQTTAGSASTGSKLTVSIETIDTTNGLPTGTTIVSQAYDNPVTFPVTFTTAGTINKGTFYALRVTQTGTPGTTKANFVSGLTGSQITTLVPYAFGNGVINGTRQAESFYLEDSAGSPLVMGFPIVTSSGNNINNALQAGMKFKIPTTVCSTYKLVGIRLSTDTNATGTPPNIRLSIYDWNSGNNSTALDSVDCSPFAVASATQLGVNEYWFDSPTTLNAGSDYIVAVGTADTGSATIVTTIRNMGITDSVKPVMWDYTNDYTFDRVSRTSYTGSWTVTADSIYTMSLMMEIVSLPSGGGAYPIFGGMVIK